ncbi:MAG: hypothetical protein MI922_17065 [Bacteroidales bacterium]|nr:hypothetical protein [Bacteroidales bacterium]
MKIIEIDEFSEMIKQESFRKKWFANKELAAELTYGKIQSLAARYMIKLAISEIITGYNEYTEIEIANQSNGKPYLVFGDLLHKKMKRNGIHNIQISISHTRYLAAGLVVVNYNSKE